MPRKGRGGARQGTPGTAYGQRTDLNQPISTVPNQEYGMAKQQADAQRAVPMAASPVAAAPAQPAPASTGGAPLPRPGELPHLEPTNRPEEPVTAGLPFGPGPDSVGPENLNASMHLSNAARLSGSETLQGLAAMASMMGV